MRFMVGPGTFIRTLVHLKVSQVLWRIRYKVRHWLGGVKVSTTLEGDERLSETALQQLRHWAGTLALHCPPDLTRIQDTKAGRFTYLNRAWEVEPGASIWSGGEESRLWQYTHQYQEFIRDLALDNVPEAWVHDRQQCMEWMHGWIAVHPPAKGIAWEAYPVSVRIMNWSLACGVFHITDTDIHKSLKTQAEVLLRSVEYDIQANHLLKNAAALVIAGSLLGEPYRTKGMDLLEREVARQILADGGHYERSPYYHVQVLLDLLTVQAVCDPVPKWLGDACFRMGAALASMVHPDGDVALFHDAALGAWPPPQGAKALVAASNHASGIAATRLPDMGIYRLGPGDGKSIMLAKAGKPGPPYQLGHAHGDFGSFELSLGWKRVFVNSGTHGYAENPHRNILREVAAHNVARVNDGEQLECWATFRVGRRYSPTKIKWKNSQSGTVLRAGHMGYRPYRHERTLAWVPDQGWWVEDDFEGRGAMKVESFLHVHPDYHLEATASGFIVLDQQDEEVARVLVSAEVHGEIVQGDASNPVACYHPAFGVQVPTSMLHMKTTGEDSVLLGYAIVPRGMEVTSYTNLVDAAMNMNQ